MKDKTKHFAELAGFMLWRNEPWNPGDVVDWSARYDDELQRFADLMVNEAIRVVEKRFMGDLNREDMEVRRCIDDIKNHFGVE